MIAQRLARRNVRADRSLIGRDEPRRSSRAAPGFFQHFAQLGRTMPMTSASRPQSRETKDMPAAGSADRPPSCRRSEYSARSGCRRTTMLCISAGPRRHWPPTSGVLEMFLRAKAAASRCRTSSARRRRRDRSRRSRATMAFGSADRRCASGHRRRPRTEHGRSRSAASRACPIAVV